MAGHMRTGLVLAALAMAVGRRRPPPGLLHQGDRGSQNASWTYRQALEQHRMVVSMSGKGNCCDNWVLEGFFCFLRSEWVADQRYWTRDQARREILQYIEMEYNSNRLQTTLGYITPREQQMAVAA